MNHKFFGENDSPEHKLDFCLKMVVIIVNRNDAKKTTDFLTEKHFHFQFTFLAEGTSGSEILDLFGLGSTDKTVVLSVAPDFRIAAILSELSNALKLHKPGKGIAFTIPLSGIGLHGLLNPWIDQMDEKWNTTMENEVDKMSESITHDVIIAIVDKGNSEELIEVAKDAGATGGTVINARRSGMGDAIKFLDIPVQGEKEIIAILTKREIKHNIMNAINDSYGIKTQAHGIVLSLPVDSMIGLDV